LITLYNTSKSASGSRVDLLTGVAKLGVTGRSLVNVLEMDQEAGEPGQQATDKYGSLPHVSDRLLELSIAALLCVSRTQSGKSRTVSGTP
jgi:hypothetical protein